MFRNLTVESLELRDNPAVTAIFASGALIVTGTDAAEEIRVRQVSQSPLGEGSAIFVESAEILVNGQNQSFVPASSVKVIFVNGRGGDDTIDLASGVSQIYPFEEEFAVGAIIDGGRGNDFILGTTQNDVITGGAGDDDLRGLAGNDRIHGGVGNDSLSGGDGDDELFGEAGRDTLVGGRGINLLVGGNGADVIFASLADIVRADTKDVVNSDQPNG